MQRDKIGRYEIKDELGRGGMATVYRAWDPLFEREVALKVLPPELLHADPQFKMRFEREAKIIASLEHPSIVPVYDVGDDEGQPYFVMRYMSGGSLSDRIKANVMSVADALKILNQLAPGMDEAHSKGIVHRDLKPSNILFDAKGTPYISDFGIAKLSQAQGGNVTGSAIIGTPAYMAPEQAQGTGVDGRTDIYAVGIILFEMLTGRQPYEADTPMAVAFKHITDPVPQILESNPNLPPDVETVIQKAMAKNKDDRFATAGDLVDSLRTIASGQPLSGEQVTLKGVAPGSDKTVKGAAPKTVKASGAAMKGAIAEAQGKRGFNIWLVVVPLLLLGVIGGGAVLFSLLSNPGATEAPTQTEEVVISTNTVEVAPATETSESVPVIVDTPTDAPPAVTDTPTQPVSRGIGGADKMAFVANNEIWLMNVDGTGLEQLTFDRALKTDLQWLPDGRTIYFISGKTIKYFDITTQVVDTLVTFPAEASVDAFRVSHNGEQVMVAMSNNIWIVPFDIEYLRTVTNRNQLTRMEGACIVPTDGTRAALRVIGTRWAKDDLLVAWHFKGNDPINTSLQAEQVSIFDVTACDPTRISVKDTFPGTRFTPEGYQNREIPDFDWDGLSQFVFNVSRRNNGWGEMYIYNWETHRPTKLTPLGVCCYRDARFSPDGTYLLFEFQDILLGPAAQTQVFYLSIGDLNTGARFEPFAFPEGFFENPREAFQPALRPTQP